MSKLFTIKGTNWRVQRDVHGNHSPQKLREVKKDDGTTEMKWSASISFHPNLGRALGEIIDTELYTGMPASVEVVEALNLYNKIQEKVLAGVSSTQEATE